MERAERMRASSRIILLAVLALAIPALAGCADFDPDKLDVFGLNEKKKLPGERKELFPGGVPGVTQGIPPEYVKGNHPPPETAQALQAPAPEQDKAAEEAGREKKAAAAEPEPPPKPKPKRAAKSRTASQQPTQAPSQPQQQMAPWPQQSPQPAPQQAQSPWPTQGQTTTAPWPSSPQPGTFSR
jgi:outer membrane biosynthesis protein TonB